MINEKISTIIQELKFFQKEGTMKLRKTAFLVFLVISITFLYCKTNTSLQTQCQSRQNVEEIRELIRMGSTVVPKDPRDKIQDVAEKIYNDYLELCKCFENDDFKGMADLLGKKASLFVDGEYIRGRGPIGKYFEKKKTPEGGGYQRVEFVLLWAVIVHEDRRPLFAKDSDNMVYENFGFHLINQRGGRIIKNQDGYGERSGRHTQGCPWGEN